MISIEHSTYRCKCAIASSGVLVCLVHKFLNFVETGTSSIKIK